ncbi:MAG TPA: ABC transporter ATP-binding protein [Acidimicrobiales bacterium]|nr:ABC transporter ATP-binding protein [Acidimicrobiales bacterium]
MPAIDVSSLVVRYGDLTAVDRLDLQAEAGEITVLLGPNGAGKTTTVETLEGYRRPDAGTVRILGLDPVADRAALVPRLGVMLQRGGVYPSMGARRVLGLFASFYEDPADPAALIEQLGLGAVADIPWRRLSGGEQQRLSLALALVGRPEVAFLDEPTAGVDPAGRIGIRDTVAGLRGEGVCVLMTTHDLDEAERLADRIVIVDHGRVVAAGSPTELRRAGAGGPIRFGAPPGLDVAGLGATLGAPVAEERPGEYTVDTAPTPSAIASLTAWLAERNLPLADLQAGRHRLEDVFLRLTSDREEL